jgi:phage-related protein
MNLEQLIVPLVLDNSKFKKSVDESKKKIGSFSDGLSSSLKNISGKLNDIGGKMTKSFTLPIVAGLGATVMAASNLEQSIGGVERVFKDSQDTIFKFGETAAQSVGLSKRAFNDLATKSGALLQNLGFDSDEAAEKVISLTQRAADLGATFGTDSATAMDAFGSALKGEFNPLEQFGIKINQAAINAKALEMGLVPVEKNELAIREAHLKVAEAQEKLNAVMKDSKSTDLEKEKAQINLEKAQQRLSEEMEGNTGVIDDNAKAQAALALIEEQSADSAGAFASESDTLAGSMQTAKAQLEDVGAELGNVLMPYVVQAVEFIRDLVTKFQELDPSIKKVIVVVLAIVAAIGPLISIIGTVSSVIGFLVPIFSAVAGAIGTVISFIMALNPVVLIIIGVVIALIAIWKLFGDEIKEIWEKVKEWISQAVDNIVEAIKGWFEKIKERWESLKELWEKWKSFWTGLRDIAVGIFKQMISNLIRNVNFIKDKVVGAFDSIKRAIQKVKNFIQPFIDKIREIAGAMPDWLIPGSPTDFEIGLRGIREEFIEISAVGNFPGAEMANGNMPIGGGEPIDYNKLARTLAHELQKAGVGAS